MDLDYSGLPFQHLQRQGHLHVRNFLTDLELGLLRRDWEQCRVAAKSSTNENYPIVDVKPGVVWRFHRKLKAVTDAVARATGIEADVDAGGNAYFSTAKGVDFCWHQDHESYFTYQQHSEYLNFYIPIWKPSLSRTNLCLLPMDRLETLAPAQAQKLVGSGAKRYYPSGSETLVCDDDIGEEFMLPFNLEQAKAVPELQAGDLLLMRGDVIHRTQDTETDRVAISFRRTSSRAPISRVRFESGCARKREMIQNNWPLYKSLSDCFESLDMPWITAAQFQDFVLGQAAR